MSHIAPLGDRAFLVTLDDPVHASSWAAAVRAARLPGVVDIVPAFAKVAVFAEGGAAPMKELQTRLKAIRSETASLNEGREVVIPVRYNGEDLPEVARTLRQEIADVVAAHTGSTYVVEAMGFLPGYPYAGPLPEPLRGLPRRASPRVRVPAGSVAIVGNQTGIYPQESPGGWHLLGLTPLAIVDVPSAHFPIRVGDRIRFRAIDDEEFRAREGELL